MMRWMKMMSWAGEQYSLVEFLDAPLPVFRFWGTASIDFTGKYRIVAYTSDRRELQTVEESISSLEEAQTAIEKFLFDNGTLKEGDEIEYE